jgi:hypothetical protein
MNPPITIANGPEHAHRSDATPIGRRVATHTKAAATIPQKTSASAIVATISLPFAANATIHPTSNEAMRCATPTPSSTHMYA